MTKSEKLKLATLKKKTKAETKSLECTTIPAFLDLGKQLLSFKFKGTNYAGRISFCSNPGFNNANVRLSVF